MTFALIAATGLGAGLLAASVFGSASRVVGLPPGRAGRRPPRNLGRSRPDPEVIGATWRDIGTSSRWSTTASLWSRRAPACQASSRTCRRARRGSTSSKPPAQGECGERDGLGRLVHVLPRRPPVRGMARPGVRPAREPEGVRCQQRRCRPTQAARRATRALRPQGDLSAPRRRARPLPQPRRRLRPGRDGDIRCPGGVGPDPVDVSSLARGRPPRAAAAFDPGHLEGEDTRVGRRPVPGRSGAGRGPLGRHGRSDRVARRCRVASDICLQIHQSRRDRIENPDTGPLQAVCWGDGTGG